MSWQALIRPLRAIMAEERGIAVGVWWNVALLLGSLAAMPFDRRSILGINPWIKPIKFDLSVIVFLLTVGAMLWALRNLRRWPRILPLLGWGFAVAMIVEDSLIVLQAARGVRSHMNYTTLFDGILFGVMGVFIALNTILAGWLLALWCIAKTEYKKVVVWSVRLGLLMLLLASVEGFRIVTWGGHTVGAADGGPGLPFVNWSTNHGDLRVAHFFALHALQLFPFAGLFLASTRLREQLQVALLFTFAVLYLTGIWWLFTTAMRGIQLLR